VKGAGEVRERILGVAEELFLTHGFGRVTMDELAAELGMSKKTLYQHFASKEEICAAALERAFAVVDAALEQALGEEGLDFSERLTRFVRIVAARFDRSGPFLRDLRRDAPALYDRAQELRREAIQRRSAALFAAGIQEGALRADVRPELILRMVLTLAEHLVEPRTLADLGMDPAEAYQQVMAVILDGIRVRPAPSGRAPRRAR
jgi:AcrR family transcriptional regulator